MVNVSLNQTQPNHAMVDIGWNQTKPDQTKSNSLVRAGGNQSSTPDVKPEFWFSLSGLHSKDQETRLPNNLAIAAKRER